MEFTDFVNFIEFKSNYAKLPRGTTEGYITWKPAFIRLLHVLVCAGIFVGVTGILGYDPMHCGEPEFINEGSLGWRFLFINLTSTAQRGFYYFTWCFLDCACIASGVSFNGFDKDGNPKWDRVEGVWIWEFEFNPSSPVKSKAWNHQIHIWLKNYVGERLVEPGKKATMREEMITYLVSGWWHGFNAFYTVIFFALGLLGVINKEFYKSRILFTGIPYASIIANVLNMFIVNFLGIAFTLITFERCINLTKATYGIPWILLPVVLAVVKILDL